MAWVMRIMKKLTLKKFSIVLIAFIIILESVNSMLVVEIAPKNTNSGILELYGDEVGEYGIRVINVSNEPIKNGIIKVVASGSLVIIKGLEERTSVTMELGAMQPLEKKDIVIKVKPVTRPRQYGEANIITVYYGQGKYTRFTGTYVGITKGPLNVKAELRKYTMARGEENRVDAELKNISANEQIKDLDIYLKMPPKFDSKDSNYAIAYLNPSDSLKKSFSFSPDPSIMGTQYLALIAEFEDQRGKHVIEKNFKVEIQDKIMSAALILVLIVGLVGVYIFMRKGEKKQPQQ